MEKFNPQEFDRIALIAVDVQNDFCPNGSLAVEEGDLVVPALNKVMDALENTPLYRPLDRGDYLKIERLIVATRDWHPYETNHFNDEPNFQTTWPRHCVANTTGAAFHPGLALRDHRWGTSIVSKGTRKDEDAYSGFDGETETGLTLDELLRGQTGGKTALLIGGLATDYCVKATVLDAIDRKYTAFVLKDAVRGVAPETTNQAEQDMQAAGAVFIETDDALTALRDKKG